MSFPVNLDLFRLNAKLYLEGQLTGAVNAFKANPSAANFERLEVHMLAYQWVVKVPANEVACAFCDVPQEEWVYTCTGRDAAV